MKKLNYSVIYVVHLALITCISELGGTGLSSVL